MSSITLNTRAIGSVMRETSNKIDTCAQQISTSKDVSNPAAVIISSKAQGSYMMSKNTARHLTQGAVVAGFALDAIGTLQGSLDTATNSVHELLNGSLSPDAKEALFPLIDASFKELQRVATDTEFNGRKLLNGDSAGSAGITLDTSGILSGAPASSSASFTLVAPSTTKQIVTIADKLHIVVDSGAAAEGVTTNVQTSNDNAMKFRFGVVAAASAPATAFTLATVTPDSTAANNLLISIGAAGATESVASGTLTLDGAKFDTVANVSARVDFAVGAINANFASKGFLAYREGTNTLVIKKSEDPAIDKAKGDAALGASYGGVAGSTSYLAGVIIGNNAQASVSNTAASTAASVYDNIESLTYTVTTGTATGVAAKVASFIDGIASQQGLLSNDVITKIGMLEASSAAGVVTLTSKVQGQAGAFSFTGPSGATVVSTFDVGAKSGSLGVNSVGAQGSLGADSIIQSVSQKASYTNLSTILSSAIVDGSYLSFFGRTITLKNNVTDSANQVQVLASSKAGTIANLVEMLNNSNDPTFKNFIFTSYVDSSGGILFGARSRTYNSETNGRSFTFNSAAGVPLATCTFAGGVTGGIDVSHITENKDFIGKLGGVTAAYNGTNKVTLSMTVGSVVYSGQVAKTDSLEDQVVVMTAQGGTGGYFIINLAGGNGAPVSSVSQANSYASYINKALENITFYQTLDMKIAPTSGGVLEGSSMKITTGDTVGIVTKVNVSAATADQAGAISITMEDGDVFSSSSDRSLIGANNLSSKALAVAGDMIQAGQILILSSEHDVNKRITITFGKNIDLTNGADVLALQKELATALKAGESDFSFILPSGDTVTINIPDMRGKALLDGKEWTDLKYDTTANAQITLGILLDVKTKILQIYATVNAGTESMKNIAGTFTSSLDGLKAIVDANTGVELDELIAQMALFTSEMERASALFAKVMAQNEQMSRTLSGMLR